MELIPLQTGQDLAEALGKNLCRSTVGNGCFNYADKPIETVPHMVDVPVTWYDSSWHKSKGTLTGRRCWAYSGVGNAYEVSTNIGFVWTPDWQPVGDIPSPHEPFTTIPDLPCRRLPDDTMFGVRLPRRTVFLDERSPEGQELKRIDPAISRDEWAMNQHGFTTYYHKPGYRKVSMSIGCSGICDTRNPQTAYEHARAIKSIRKALAEQWRKYRRAKRNQAKKGEGGSVSGPPAVVSFNNFGWSIYYDEDLSVVESFNR